MKGEVMPRMQSAGDGNRLVRRSPQGEGGTRTPVARPRILSPFQNPVFSRQLPVIAAYQQFNFAFSIFNFRYFRSNPQWFTASSRKVVPTTDCRHFLGSWFLSF